MEVEADDGVDLISNGKHERFIIIKDKFDAKMEEKTKKQEHIMNSLHRTLDKRGLLFSVGMSLRR